MHYAPHKLYLVERAISRNEYGYPSAGEETEREVCGCRCDESDGREVILDNGEAYIPRYHIVCPGGIGVKYGDFVRAKAGVSVRGEGKVVKVKGTNYYSYTELWV